jgi:CheY-like chemotaxis protein
MPYDVLLVDDDADYRRLMAEILEATGLPCRLHQVATGAGALDFLNRRGAFAQAPHVDLVYLDIDLPERSGQQVLSAIKGDPALCGIPVVMLTGLDDDQQKLLAARHGANSYVLKPSDPPAMMDLLGRTHHYWLCVHQHARRAA